MTQDEEDPFSVVKPQSNNVKMSQYIKHHKQRREIEECSHGTNSTRSTTISNRTDDQLQPTSFHKSASSSNSGMLSGSTSDGSFANFGEEEEEGEGDAPAISFGSDFGNGLEFGSRGGETPSSRSRKSRGSRKESSNRKPKSEKQVSSTGSSGNDDAFFSSDPFATSTGFEDEPVNFGDGDFGENLFGDDPFGDSIAFDDDGSGGKRESFRQNPRSNSHSENRRSDRVVPRRHHSSDAIDSIGMATAKPQSRRRMVAEQGVRSSEMERNGPPVRARGVRSRRASLDFSSHARPARPDDEQSLFSTQTEPADLSMPLPRRTRRSSLGYTQSDGSFSGVSNPSLSNRSLAILPPPAPSGIPSQRGVPQRHKSSVGTSMDPRVGVRRMRSRRPGTSNDGSFCGDSNHSALAEDVSIASDGTKDKKWTTDRSRNQEMIMSMYKDGAALKKHANKDCGSSSDLGKDMDALGINEEDLFSPSMGDLSGAGEKKRRSALSTLKKMTKKKDLNAPPEEDKTVTDARNLTGRSRGTLLERVGAVDEPSSRSSAALRKGGSSYSDRILTSSNRR